MGLFSRIYMKILDKKVRVKVEVKMILLDSGLPEIKQMQFAPRQDTLLKTTLKHAAIHISVLHNRSSLLTYSMQQSPSWEANWFSANQEILRILWNPKVHYRTHKRSPPVPILSQLHPVPTTPFHFLKIHLNIILPSTSLSPQWSLSLRFPPPKPCAHLSLPPYVPHAPPISFFSILSPAKYWVRSTEH